MQLEASTKFLQDKQLSVDIFALSPISKEEAAKKISDYPKQELSTTFAVGEESGSRGCSARTFGHSGSTGTLCWADPATESICVVLTSLPARAAKPHPREPDEARAAVQAVCFVRLGLHLQVFRPE